LRRLIFDNHLKS